MSSDLDRKAKFLEQLPLDGRFHILPWLNPTPRKTNQPRSTNMLRTPDDQEVSVFVENSDDRMASLIPRGEARLARGIRFVRIGAHKLL
jgi:hypothetical protein